MSANVDSLKKGYDAMARGDVATAAELLPDDFVLEGPDAEGPRLSGIHEGKEAALRAFAASAEAWDEQKVVPDEFIEQGDTIVMLGHVKLRRGETAITLPAVHVWRFSNGQSRRLQIVFDTLHVAQAFGWVEPSAEAR